LTESSRKKAASQPKPNQRIGNGNKERTKKRKKRKEKKRKDIFNFEFKIKNFSILGRSDIFFRDGGFSFLVILSREASLSLRPVCSSSFFFSSFLLFFLSHSMRVV